MALSRQQILTADDRKYATIDVPEWGGTVRLRSMDAASLLDYQEKVKARPDDINALVTHSLVRCVVDDVGELLFTETDVELLLKKNPAVLLDIHAKAIDLNSLNRKAVEEHLGNSESGPSVDSPIPLPLRSAARM